MNIKKDSNLVPKLRFPDFQDKPAWEMKKLSSVADVNPKNGGGQI